MGAGALVVGGLDDGDKVIGAEHRILGQQMLFKPGRARRRGEASCLLFSRGSQKTECLALTQDQEPGRVHCRRLPGRADSRKNLPTENLALKFLPNEAESKAKRTNTSVFAARPLH